MHPSASSLKHGSGRQNQFQFTVVFNISATFRVFQMLSDKRITYMALHACIHFLVDQEEYEGTCKTSSFISDVMMVRNREAARVEALSPSQNFSEL